MNIKQAKEIPLEVVLKALGAEETSAKADRSEIWFLSPLRSEKTASFKINVRKNIWYDHGQGMGGDIVKLVCECRNLTISEALKWLKPFYGVTPPENIQRPLEGKKTLNTGMPEKLIAVKERTITNRALCQYIGGRGISLPLAREFCKEIYYKNEKGRSLYGVAMQNDCGGWEMRAAIGDFKSNVNGRDLTTIKPDRGEAVSRLHVFEGFFDFLTQIEKYGREEQSAYMILNSAAMAENGILKIENDPDLTGLKEVFLWLDNDPTGERISNLLTDRLHDRYTVGDLRPMYEGFKDLNKWWTDSPKARQMKEGPKLFYDPILAPQGPNKYGPPQA